jgi:integrase/recombinase XerD
MNKEIARAELQRDYETYLRRQRGLSERTIFHSWRIADRFLEFRFGKEIGDLSRITTTDIVGFLQHLTTRTPPLRDKTLSSHLRNFFRYLFKAGKTATNLALGIPSVAQRYGTRLPRHLTTEQVDMLVRAVRTDRAGGRRNYAMVLLLARLGLRGPEVIAMQLDDIDSDPARSSCAARATDMTACHCRPMWARRWPITLNPIAKRHHARYS